MSILSQIIAKAWFKALAGCLLALILLLTVGDVVNGLLRGYAFSRVFTEYLLKLPTFMSELLPICCLAATLFSLNTLKSHSELVAILSGGYHSKKLYKLTLLFTSLIALLQFLNIGFIEPYANKIERIKVEKSVKKESKYIARSRIGGEGYLWIKNSSYFISFSAFDRQKNQLRDFSIYYTAKNKKIESILKSKYANYYKDDLWELKEADVIKNLDESNFPIHKKEKGVLISLNERPTDFSGFESDITTLNIFKLSSLIKKLEFTGINVNDYSSMLYSKIVHCLKCILFGLIPLIGLRNPNRRNSSFGKNILFAIAFSAGFWIINTYVSSLGFKGVVSMKVAHFIVPIVFVLIIFKMYQQTKRLK